MSWMIFSRDKDNTIFLVSVGQIVKADCKDKFDAGDAETSRSMSWRFIPKSSMRLIPTNKVSIDLKNSTFYVSRVSRGWTCDVQVMWRATYAATCVCEHIWRRIRVRESRGVLKQRLLQDSKLLCLFVFVSDTFVLFFHPLSAFPSTHLFLSKEVFRDVGAFTGFPSSSTVAGFSLCCAPNLFFAQIKDNAKAICGGMAQSHVVHVWTSRRIVDGWLSIFD